MLVNCTCNESYQKPMNSYGAFRAKVTGHEAIETLAERVF